MTTAQDPQREQAMRDLDYEIARHGLEYADNYRACRLDDAEGLAAYNRQAARGCCGAFDTTTKIDGNKWAIGCNYGH